MLGNLSGLLLVGLAITVSSIAGIIALGRRVGSEKGFTVFFMVLGMMLLSLLAFVGILAVGCGASGGRL